MAAFKVHNGDGRAQFLATSSGTGTEVDPYILNFGAGGGGGGGASTIANGADVAEGSTTDSAQTDGTQTATVVALLKGLVTLLAGGTPVAGTLSATITAAALGTNLTCRSVIVQNLITNTVDILVGDSSSQPVRLVPGQTLSMDIKNRNLLYIKTVSSTASVPYLVTT